MKLFVHIGYPKTATTTLQNLVFLKLHNNGELNYLGRSVDETSAYYPIIRVIKGLIEDDDKVFEQNLDSYSKELHELLNDRINNLLSEELLSETLFYGSYERNVFRNLSRLKSLTSNIDVEIIMTVRSQYDAIYSLFVEWLPKHFWGDKNYSDFNNYLINNMADELKNIQMFDYYKVSRCAQQYFGNVNILLYEELVKEPMLYAQKWADILNVDSSYFHSIASQRCNEKVRTNQGYVTQRHGLSDKLSHYINRVNWLQSMKKEFYYKSGFLQKIWLQYFKVFLDRLYSTNGKMIEKPTNEDLMIIRKLFSNSNLELDKKYSLGLKEHNYPF